jgi:ABC-type branched-subunit amino acid transport system substrate-binding protein
LRHTTVHLSAILLLSLSCLVGLSACAGISNSTLSIGALSNGVNSDGGKLTSPVAEEQENGYQAGLRSQGNQLVLKSAAEGNQEGDVQVAIRQMAEQEKVVAISGATSNEASVRAAGLVNFFNVPMVIPGSYGETILPSNNLWAFRLSPPSSSYAQYFFGALQPVAPADSSAIKIAILYEQNTFGESAAVATAHAALKQGFDIGKYAFFNASGADAQQLKTLAEAAMQENVQLIYMISSDPAVAQALVRAIKAAYTAQSLPALVGQSGGFASQSFLATPDSEGVFILRQELDPKNCPAEIKTIAEAQSFAAVYLIDQAVSQVKENTPPTGTFTLPAMPFSQPADPVISLREKVRDALKTTNLNIPCLGLVAFDNTGQNKLLRFELLRVVNGKVQLAAPIQLLNSFPTDSSSPATNSPAPGG